MTSHSSSSCSSSASVEEWLKQANQNKINSKNSFNVQLIDYFHSLSKEKSVNFLQVSYTLDGCVKVYTSRVDAVNKESEDLLQGLISSGGKSVVVVVNKKKEDDDDDDHDGVKTTTTSTSKKSSSLTLKEDSIKLKKFELIPSSLSDPCFLKITSSTSTKDETIVDKLLMNQLESNEGLDYIIDSKQYYPLLKKDETIATSMLDVQSILTTPTLTTPTSNCSICPALKHFDFTKRDFTLDTLIREETEDDDDEVVYNDEFVYVVEPIPDLMVLQEQDSEGDSECIGFEEDQQVLGDNVVNEGHTTTSTKFSVSRNDYDLHLFSSTSALKKNWAGPEHFKLTRILQQGLGITSSSSGGDRKKTTGAAEFRIDFNNIGEDRLTEDVLFKKTTTTSAAAAAAAKTLNTTILLPVDLNYGYDDIRRMFLKPKFKVGYQEEEEEVKREEGDYAAVAVDDVDYPDHYDDQEEDTNVPFESLQFTQSQSHQEEDNNKGLNYTKRAKRVDVKKLKDTLWQDIQQQQQQHDKEDVSFKKVLQDTELKHTNNEDITISYYFICLLHLCNEKEMELEEKEGKDLKLVVSCCC